MPRRRELGPQIARPSSWQRLIAENLSLNTGDDLLGLAAKTLAAVQREGVGKHRYRKCANDEK
jgi:hypothetical protein